MKSDLVDIDVALHMITDRAVRVSLSGEDDKAVWLPLSQVEIVKRPKAMATVTLPERMAIEKGLV